MQQSSPHPNACLTCDHFLTTAQFLDQHRDQLTRTEQLIADARAAGRQRLVEMNEPVRLNQPRIACVRVVSFQAVPYRRWPTGFFNHFPLPAVAGAGTQASDLQEWLTVENSELHRERRRLTLTEWGVIVMQQRLIHSLTRFVAPTGALEEAARPVLREAELERDWVEGLEGTASLEQLVADFSVFMGETDRPARLRDRAKESAARREVAGEIKARQGADAGAAP